MRTFQPRNWPTVIGQERLDDNGGEDIMQGQVVGVEGEREAYGQIIHTGGNAEADNGKAVRGDHCPRLACLVVVIVVIIVIEGLVQHPDANGADDQWDENRVDIPTEERLLEDVGRVTEVGRVNLVGIGRGSRR